MSERSWVRLAPDERQSQILRAAAELFSTRGFDEISTTDLAAAAGVSRGLLNHYFRTKRDLYLAVVRSLVDLPPPPLPDYFAGMSADERLRRSVSDWLDLTELRAPLWLSAQNVSRLGHDAEVKELLDEATDRVVDRVLEVAGLSELARGRTDLRAALRGYAGFTNALTAQWLQEGELDRGQVQLLLEGVLSTLVRDLLPRL